MDNASYATLTRQSGLRQEMQVIAHNIANAATSGYQKEGLIFSEYVQKMEDSNTSLSMATANARMIDRSQGQLTRTGGTFDVAIEGDGYFMVQTPEGNRLTRAGSFHPNAEGLLAASDGAFLLDSGEVPIFVPPGVQDVHIGRDGSIGGDGQPLGQIGVFEALDPAAMTRVGGVRFEAAGGTAALENVGMVQGFLESSNVDPVLEVARMIEVQRAYERGRDLMTTEDERIRGVIQTLGQ
jgi:flagellar basal-body rod protein FlgF